MIVASLLLILVAVALLVMGLTGGSSGLLISSIVASLLAAVALVIGARQAASARRGATLPGDHREPEPAFTAEPEFAASATRGPRRSDDFAPPPEPFAGDRRDTVQLDPVADQAQGDLSADDARSAGRRDAAEAIPAEPDPDYDRASSVISSARTASPGEGAWRRDQDMSGDFADPDADDPEDEPLPQSVSPSDAVRVARLDAEVLVVDGRPRYHLADCPHLVGRLTEPIPVNEAVELGFTPCGLCRPVDRLAAATTHH